jgi:hypothetical protein
MKKFKQIFEGLSIAYGQYQKGERGENGKQKGRAFIVRKNVTDELWKNHIKGEGPALGIIPINESNQCKWGCIDIDEYNFNHSDLVSHIRELKLPLVVCRSKSGGAHVFLFTKDFISAAQMQGALKSYAEILGYDNAEIFPKQTEILVERGDTGNFLNLPYHKEMQGLRYAIKDDGTAATLQEFYDLYDQYVQTELKEIKKEKKKEIEIFLDGPPCLNKLASQGFTEGSRNNALFNIAIYCKQAYPDSWEKMVDEYNTKYMKPAPLGSGEVQQLIKSIGKKGYDKYRCKLPPIESVCNSALCRTKRFGVGYDEEQVPTLGNLTKYASRPPQWFLNVGDARIELKTEQLYSPALFALACLDQANLIIPVVKPKDWKQVYLKPLIENGLQEIEPLESLDPKNQITSLLQDWTTNRQSARTLEDIFNKLPYTDENKEFTYFRMEDFYNFCKRNNWEMDKTKTGNLIKQLDCFEKEIRKELKGGMPRLIQIKTMKKQETTVSKVEYEEHHF